MQELLRDPHTAFLIVTSPELEPAREAAYLADRLKSAGMSRGELIFNRVHGDGLAGRSVQDVTNLLTARLGADLAGRVARNLQDFDLLVQRDRETVARLSRELGQAQPVLVPALDEDIQDLRGLARISEYLLA